MLDTADLKVVAQGVAWPGPVGSEQQKCLTPVLLFLGAPPEPSLLLAEELSWDSAVQQPGVLGSTRLHLESSGAFLSPQGQLPEAPAVSLSPEQ